MVEQIDRVVVVKHCTVCDSVQADAFLEWLSILEAGSKVKITNTAPCLHLDYIQKELNCASCVKDERLHTVTMVVFEWANLK